MMKTIVSDEAQQGRKIVLAIICIAIAVMFSFDIFIESYNSVPFKYGKLAGYAFLFLLSYLTYLGVGTARKIYGLYLGVISITWLSMGCAFLALYPLGPLLLLFGIVFFILLCLFVFSPLVNEFYIETENYLSGKYCKTRVAWRSLISITAGILAYYPYVVLSGFFISAKVPAFLHEYVKEYGKMIFAFYEIIWFALPWCIFYSVLSFCWFKYLCRAKYYACIASVIGFLISFTYIHYQAAHDKNVFVSLVSRWADWPATFFLETSPILGIVLGYFILKKFEKRFGV